MASSTKRFNKDTGREFWQVRIRRKGYPPISKNFDTKREADDFGILMESKLLRNEAINPQEASKWTIPQVIEWYRQNPNPHRKLETRKHLDRLKFLEKEFEHFTVVTLTPKILSKWIQKRLEINKPATVYHYYVALKNALEYHSVQHDYSQAIFSVVKCPTKSGERNRRFSAEETKALFKGVKAKSKTKQKEMMLTVLFAIQTACRVGEMLKLNWSEVNLDERYLDFLAENTKTKVGRRIPLTTVAVKILKWFKKQYNPEGLTEARVFPCWNINEHHLSRQFQISCEREGIEDIRWHDLRHEGTSRLFEWVNPRNGHTLTDMEIASITGHKSMNMLRRYAHLRPSSIIPKLW